MKINVSQIDMLRDRFSTAKARAASPLTIRSGPPVLGQDYVVFIINMSDWLVIGVSVNGNDAYLPTPFGRTCSTNEQDCFEHGGYQPAATSNCREAPYRFKVIIRWPPTGAEYYSNEITISPTCDKIGVVVPMNIPSP
jgi:hypothetical protein